MLYAAYKKIRMCIYDRVLIFVVLKAEGMQEAHNFKMLLLYST
jgi:hypothetical protein